MSKTLKNKKLICGLIICLVVCLALGIFALPNVNAYAQTEPVTGNYDEDFVVTDTADEVLAEYQYSVINETECNVRITNKTTATKAIIPNVAEIDGKEYKVTEIAVNGFLSAAKLVRVKLPSSIKKIGNMAFANCTSLQRVVMANVVEIGNNAFYRCTSLEHLVLPQSVQVVGSTILRSNNTQVHIRAQAASENWAENWNTGNTNTEVDYNSQYIEPLELETIYRTVARTSEPQMVGYAVAEGQPRTDMFYEEQGSNIFLPNMYNGDYLLAINNGAFENAVCEKLVIEYSAKTLFIGSNTFEGLICDDIIINRNISFYDEQTDTYSDNIFTFSSVKRIVLPDTVTELPVAAFTYCTELTNIFFATPQYEEKREVVLQLVDNLAADSEVGVVYLPNNSALTTIREAAFMGTMAINEVHIYDNITNVETSIFTDWTDAQQVFVHNGNRNMSQVNGYNWHPQWHNDVSDANVHYDAKYYTITFHFDDGTNNTVTKDVKFGEPIGTMPTNDYEYHNLYAWADGNSEVWAETTIYNIEKDLDLYACYSAYLYTVFYNVNSPDPYLYPVYGEMQPSVFAYSDYLPLRSMNYTINGWDFVEWRIVVDDTVLNFLDGETINMVDVLTTLGLPTTDGYYITLDAIWELHNYTITYDPKEGTNPSSNPLTYTIQDSIIFDAPIWEGHIGSWSQEGITEGSYGDIEIEANYIDIRWHKATFLPNGGQYNYASLDFKTDEDKVLSAPERNGYSFIGWLLQGTNNTFVTNLKEFKTDITLEAIWVQTGTIYTVSSSATTLAVSATNSTVELPYSHNAIEIIVANNVKQLYLYADVYKIHYVRITVQSGRTSDLSLVLNNVDIQSNDASNPTVKMTDNRALSITAYKECVIQGATGLAGKNGSLHGPNLEFGADGEAGGKGGIAIECANLTLCSPISIIGGRGGHGGTGSSGRSGYNGGVGGNGNYAVICNKITIQSSDILIQGGNGGDGGNGGSGYTSINQGKGARGGFGSMAVSQSETDFNMPQIVGRDSYDNVEFNSGTAGKKGVDGGESHEVIQ